MSIEVKPVVRVRRPFVATVRRRLLRVTGAELFKGELRTGNKDF